MTAQGRHFAWQFLLLWSVICSCGQGIDFESATTEAPERHRVIVSTDIGGTDPDDFQSMVHLLVYADTLDIEGLIASPYGEGRKQHILDVIDSYENDYPNLKTYSSHYPTPDTLRALTKQGETERAPHAGVRRSTEGSRWIIQCARRKDPRPLHVLVWGGIEDLAQALHDAPEILGRLRVYWIGGPNKKWAADAYQYLVTHHPNLWIIESNSTYRGWFTGGKQWGDWDNHQFVAKHVAGKGTLGDFFVRKKDELKMGDTPSVAWLLNGNPDRPDQPSWGGSYVRAWPRPFLRMDRMAKAEDQLEVFGILEMVLSLGSPDAVPAHAILVVDNQRLPGHIVGDGTIRFRFCPKAAQAFRFTLESNVAPLNGMSGGVTAYLPGPERASASSSRLPHWWTDDLRTGVSEGSHAGARTVSRWREAYLADFARRMLRCQRAATDGTSPEVAGRQRTP